MRDCMILLTTFLALIIQTEAQNATITSYDPGELLTGIFNPNITTESRQRGYGLNFGDQPDSGRPYGNYEQYEPTDHERPLKFDENDNNAYHDPFYYQDQNYNYNAVKFDESENNQDVSLDNGGPVTFQDDNKVDDQGNNKKRKRKRRRKPKNRVVSYPAAYVGPGGPGIPGPGDGSYVMHPYAYPGYQYGHPYMRPVHPHPRPSFASEALSVVIEALTSIARYDDYQCVPRLLCEAAGGQGLSSNGVLQSITSIQPLLTMLSAYNGISTSPLFVFGRAVFLGMTSKGNIGTCRYAYPECPTDPEQLIYYLNNYNGGFFRFFSAPQNPPPHHQNIEEFYSQLGQYPGIQTPQDFGNYPYYPNDINFGTNYNPNQQNDYPGPYPSQNPAQNSAFNNNRPSLYNNQDYGSNYAYSYKDYGSSNRIKFKDNNARLEKRIQNRPGQNYVDDSYSEDEELQTKWLFPDDALEIENYDYKIRDSRTMRFPEDTLTYNNNNNDYYRKGKVVNFPQNNYNNIHYNNRYVNNNNRYETTTYPYSSDQGNYYNNRPDTYQNNNYNNYKPIRYYNYNQAPINNEYQSNQNYNNHPNYPNNNNDDYQGQNYHNQRPQNYNKYQNSQNYYNNHQNMYSNYQKYPTTTFNNEEYIFDHKHNFYVKKDNYSNINFKRAEDDGLKTVYVVRGHGDPNRPEILKLKPGQSVH